MIRYAVLCGLVYLSVTPALAEVRRTVPAGKTTRVALYTAWDPVYCGSVHGVVKISVKPQRGTLSNTLIDTTIPQSRFGSSGQCLGKPTKGFAIFYTPAGGFRGTDSFTLEVSWPAINRTATDVYAIAVQ